MLCTYELLLERTNHETRPLLEVSCSDATSQSSSFESTREKTFADKLGLIKPLMLPYILPLMTVYFMEYTNLSITYAILFPLDQTPFKKYEEEYRTYQLMYQIGVFISRSSLSIAAIDRIWITAVLQTLNFVLILTDAIWPYLPCIYLLLAFLLWQGLLGGAAYVNTYANIKKKVSHENVEFSMAVTGVSDSLGISLSALISVFLEPALCDLNELCRANRIS